MFKKIIFNLIFCFGFCSFLFFWVTSAVGVDVDWGFADKRFPPIDKFHSTCVHSANFVLRSDGVDLDRLFLSFSYDPEVLQILNMETLADWTDFRHVLAYDTLTIAQDNLSGNANVDLVKILFKSKNSWSVETNIVLSSWSYVVLKNQEKVNLNKILKLDFEDVLECEPDIIVPSVELISPQNEQKNVALDSDIILEIKDLDKWVDKNNLIVNFDGDEYSWNVISWEGDLAKILPKRWLPIGKKVFIDVEARDLQDYGWANIIKKQFQFVVSSGLVFQRETSLSEFRKRVSSSYDGTDVECKTLWMFYIKSTWYYRLSLARLLRKFSCDLPKSWWFLSSNGLFVQKNKQIEGGELWKDDLWKNSLWDSVLDSLMKISSNSQKTFSVFALLGWMLFFVTFFLKIYYWAGYRKYKKKHTKLLK